MRALLPPLLVASTMSPALGICPDDCFRSTNCFEAGAYHDCQKDIIWPWGIYYLIMIFVTMVYAARSYVGFREAVLRAGPFQFNLFHVANMWPLVFSVNQTIYVALALPMVIARVDQWDAGLPLVLIVNLAVGYSLCALACIVMHLAFVWQVLLKGSATLGSLRMVFITLGCVLVVVETYYRVDRTAQSPNHSEVIFLIYAVYLVFLVSVVALWALFQVRRLRKTLAFGEQSRRRARTVHGEEDGEEAERRRQKRSFTARVTIFVQRTQYCMALTVVLTLLYGGIRVVIGYSPYLHLAWISIVDVPKFYVLFLYLRAIRRDDEESSADPPTPTKNTLDVSTAEDATSLSFAKAEGKAQSRVSDPPGSPLGERPRPRVVRKQLSLHDMLEMDSSRARLAGHRRVESDMPVPSAHAPPPRGRHSSPGNPLRTERQSFNSTTGALPSIAEEEPSLTDAGDVHPGPAAIEIVCSTVYDTEDAAGIGSVTRTEGEHDASVPVGQGPEVSQASSALSPCPSLSLVSDAGSESDGEGDDEFIDALGIDDPELPT